MHPVPGVFEGAANVVAVLVLLVEFGMLRQSVLRDQVRLYAAQSLLVSILAVVVAAGMPLILEVAFLFDLLVAVVVFGVLMRVHHARTASLSTTPMTRLRG